MTGSEAVAALVPLVGTGGLGAIVVAILGYRAQAAKTVSGAKESVGLGPVKASDIELAVNSIMQMSGSVIRLTMLREFQLKKDDLFDEFEEWVAQREMQATLAAFRAEQKARAKP